MWVWWERDESHPTPLLLDLHLCECNTRQINQGFEAIWLMHGNLWQNFPVEVYVFLWQPMHELSIIHLHIQNLHQINKPHPPHSHFIFQLLLDLHHGWEWLITNITWLKITERSVTTCHCLLLLCSQNYCSQKKRWERACYSLREISSNCHCLLLCFQNYGRHKKKMRESMLLSQDR